MKRAVNFLFLLLALTLVIGARGLFAQAPQQTASAATPATTPTPAATPQSATTAAAPTPVSPSPASRSQSAVMSPALLHAQGLYRSGKFDQAAAEYNAIIAGNGPDTAAAYAGLARLCLKQRKPEDAFAAAQTAVTLDPHLATAHSALGEVYFRQGKMVDAEREFRFPFSNKKPDARACLGLGRLYEATSNFKSAKTMLEKARALDPDDPEIGYAWMGTLAVKDHLEAIQ
jgi:tetratricopeptide (TPR) repeat protein